MTIIQVSSFGVLSTTQRIDYFWALGYVRVKKCVLFYNILRKKTHQQHLGTTSWNMSMIAMPANNGI